MPPVIEFMMTHLPTQLFGAAIIGIAGWGAKSLSDLSHNVQALNIQMATIIERINSHENRIILLERVK